MARKNSFALETFSDILEDLTDFFLFLTVLYRKEYEFVQALQNFTIDQQTKGKKNEEKHKVNNNK